MIITIDGPAGTGKSSVAQAVAEQLGFDFLDTGAMYRAIALAALRRGVDLEDPAAVTQVAEKASITFDFSHQPPEIYLDAKPVSSFIRSEDTTRASSIVAAIPGVRAVLVHQQQQIGRYRQNLVTDGRDQGTAVFPQAELKFFLDADPLERARRRAEQIRQSGNFLDTSVLLREIEERDRRDRERAVGPLARPPGGIVIDTTHLSQKQVIDQIVARVRASR